MTPSPPTLRSWSLLSRPVPACEAWTVGTDDPFSDTYDDLPAPQQFATGRALSRRYRILVAEDDSDMRALVAGDLRNDGYEVEEVSDGAMLMDRVRSALEGRSPDFDLLVTDLRMPRASGLEALDEIRMLRQSLPVILMTAFSDARVRSLAQELEADAVLDKPFALGDLRLAVYASLEPIDEAARCAQGSTQPTEMVAPPIVWLAEDDEDFRALLVALLRKDGYEVQEAEDGVDILEKLEMLQAGQTPPGLVITDKRMPLLDGLEATTAVAAKLRDVPVLLITAFADQATLAQAARAGAAVVLSKPFDLDDFRVVVHGLVPPPEERAPE